MERLSPPELLVAAGDGRNVYVVRGTRRELGFQFGRFADYLRDAVKAVVHVHDFRISFPGGGAVQFVTLNQVQEGCLGGVDNPLVAASTYYHAHELDAFLPARAERVDWC